MLESTHFGQIANWLTNHEQIYSKVEVEYTFACQSLYTQQLVISMVSAFYSFALICSIWKLAQNRVRRWRSHTMPIVLLLIIGLSTLGLLDSLLASLQIGACPWKQGDEKQLTIIVSMRNLFNTFISALAVFLMLTVAYGFDVIYAEVTPQILKIVLIMTCSRFFLFKLEQIIAAYSWLIPYKVGIEVLYNCVLIGYTASYVYVNLKVLDDIGWRLWRQSRIEGADIESIAFYRDQRMYR
jgi:hypothetical protein